MTAVASPSRTSAERMPEATSPGIRRRRRNPGASPWWALVFLGPTALGITVFYLWPTVRTLIISFTKSGPFGGAEWVGIENYTRLFQDTELIGALRNTAIYTVIALIGIPLAVAIAALLNTTGLKGRSAYRTLYFIPVVTMPAAIALVWRMMYNGDYGVLNAALGVVGIEGRSWLTDPNTALIAIAVVGIWAGLGTNIVISSPACRVSPTRSWRPPTSTAQVRCASSSRSRSRCSLRRSSSSA